MRTAQDHITPERSKQPSSARTTNIQLLTELRAVAAFYRVREPRELVTKYKRMRRGLCATVLVRRNFFPSVGDIWHLIFANRSQFAIL